MVNPQITPMGKEGIWEEGCLSVPGHSSFVERSEECKVLWQDETGEMFEALMTWPISGVIQHENDHLNGKTFLDRISRLKKNIITKKIMKKIKMDTREQKRLKRNMKKDLQNSGKMGRIRR